MIDAVIFDIDHVLADTKFWDLSRGPFDFDTWMRENSDAKVNEIGAQIFDQYVCDLEFFPIFVTARNEKGRDETEYWLAQNFGVFPLFMRPDGDTSSDADLKKRLYEEHIKDEYRVHLAVDDRSSIVKMWNSLGIKSLLVVHDRSFDL